MSHPNEYFDYLLVALILSLKGTINSIMAFGMVQ